MPVELSVVIPTFRRREMVVATVESFSRQVAPPPFEVIVVVDGSDDGTTEQLRLLDVPFPFTVVEQQNQGPAAARNRGVVEAQGEIIVFLDDDMEADPRLLAEHKRSLDSGFDVVFGDIPLHPDSLPGFLSTGVGEWARQRSQELSERSELTLHDLLTGQMSLRRSDFLSLGGFDTQFTEGNEDLDFGVRLGAAGYRLGFNPLAISRQRYVVTPADYLDRWRGVGRANVAFARKHPEELQGIFVPHRQERRVDRFALRWLRAPLRRFVLAAGPDGGPRTIRWFYRVRNLEYHRGIREAGGIPGRWPVRVLCYHALHPGDGARTIDQYSLSLREFRRQIRFLARWFRFVSLDEVVELVRGGCLVPRRAALVTFDDCYAGIADALPTLQKYGVPAAAFAVSSLLGETNAWDPPGLPRRPLLDGAGLHQLAAGGVAIGSHTRTHPMLNQLAAAELAEELAGSAADLAELGLPAPETLAYPYGEHDETVRTATAAAGYRAAFTVDPGEAVPGGDPYAIPRIEIYGADTGWRFVRKVVSNGRH